MTKAKENDDRLDKGRPDGEAEDNEKVLVWPDLVYTELICMIVCTALLIVWAIVLQGAAGRTGQPARRRRIRRRRPWYFLGLQEMLVYYDPVDGRRGAARA